jgi:hypothetical protein
MMPRRTLTLAGTSLVLLAAGIWLSTHHSAQQADLPGGKVFTDLTPELGNVNEIRLSKGDGSRTTLRKDAAGWTVVERQYPADASRVRELVLALVDMKIIEHKTSDPASYAKLGVEKPDSPAATSTLVEVTAGKKTWSLIVGKGAEGRAIYVRKPAEAVSALVEPSVSVDPDQKRWIDRLLTDIPGADVHDISVRPAAGAAYLLTRAKRGDNDLALSPIPKGRSAASSMSIDGQADTLSAFHFDDVVTAPATPAAATDHAIFRTFDGAVLEFSGHRDGAKAYVAVAASRDSALAAQFPESPPATAAKPAVPAKPADQTVEKLAARAAGLQYEIPAYKYEALFKPQEDLLEKKPEPPPKPAKPVKPVKAKK